MENEWYVLIEGNKVGPFSKKQMKKDKRITPDTLVWKNGFKEWVAIRYVPELIDLFKDENVVKGKEEVPKLSSDMQEQATLTLRHDPSQWILWVLVLILLVIYIIYQINAT